MRGLNEITLINSASVNYTTISLDGNTLLSGANGAGKTTILRAVLFFYHANGRKVDINSAKKKSFKEYYFSSLNSYLIYKYNNVFGTAYVLMYKTSLNLDIKFRFFCSTKSLDIQDIFFDERIANEFSTVISKLRKLDCDISPTIASAKEYREILYNHNKQYKQFSLFDTKKSYDPIYNTISNIFINSKLDSNVIKKSLVNSVENFTPIDLNQIRSNISQFLNEIKDIRNFEQNDSYINKSLFHLNTYNRNKEILKDLSRQIYNQYLYSKKNIESIKKQQTINDETLQHTVEQKEIKSEAFKRKLKYLDKKRIELEYVIKETKQKQAFYSSNQIQDKIELYAKKDGFLLEQDNLIQQINILQNEAMSEASKFDELINKENNSLNEFKNLKQNQINCIRQEFFEKQKKLNINQTKQIKDIETSYKEQINLQTIDIQNITDKLKDEQTHYKIENSKEFYKEQIAECKKDLKEHTEEINTFTLEIEKLKNQMAHYDGKIQIDEINIHNQINVLASKFQEQKKVLDIDIKKCERNLNIDGNTLLGFLKETDSKNKTLLKAVLKDDILFHKELNPKITTDEDTIYGLSIDKSKLDLNLFEEENVEENLKQLNEQLECLKSEFIKEKELLIQKNEKSTNVLYKYKKLLNEKMQTSTLTLNQLDAKVLKIKSKVENLQQKAKDEKNTTLKTIQKNIEVLSTLLTSSQEQLKSIILKQNNEIKSIKSTTTKQENILNSQEKQQIEIKSQDMQFYEKSIKQNIKDMLEQKEVILSQKGIDTNRLNNKISTLDNIKNNLRKIDDITKIVLNYEKEKEELFDLMPDKSSELKRYVKDIDELNFTYSKEIETLKTSLIQLNDKKSLLQKEYDKFDTNINVFENLVNTHIYESIKVNFTNEEKINEFEDIVAIKDKIYGIDNQIKVSLQDLGKSLHGLFRNISDNNILNLHASKSGEETDILTCAINLQEFVNDKKIEFFKKELSSRYSQSLSHYEKEIKNLLNAQGTIQKTINNITKNLKDLKNIKVIEKIELRYADTQDKAVQLLSELKTLYENNSFKADVNLFNPMGADDEFNQKVITIFEKLHTYLYEYSKKEFITLEDSFVLEFRAIENGNDTGFVQILDDVGSNGTDVMVKVMVYISMLNLAYEQCVHKHDQNNAPEANLYFHCILDEVGILSPKYLKELIRYANAHNIRFVNGAPDEKIVTTYKRVYMLRTTAQHKTIVNEIVSQI